MRETLYKTDGVHLEIEVDDELPYLHCQITDWNRDKYMEYLEVFVSIQESLKANGLDYLFAWAPDDKVRRFAEMFGFKTVITDMDGVSLMFMRY